MDPPWHQVRQGGFSPLSVQSVWRYLDQSQLRLKVAVYGIEGVRLNSSPILRLPTGTGFSR